MADTSIERFRRVVEAAYGHLEQRRQEVNDLNVFPVADGDTGDNMALTMRAVMSELDRLDGQPIDKQARETIVHAVARAALMGARGNSGVILSQIVRGAAEELASRRGELVDPVLVAAAFASAADAAYESVRDPAEGTMLTVIREMAHAVSQHLAHMDRQRLSAEAGDTEQDELLAEVLAVAAQAGQDAVERTPEQLDVLAKAGVVDAGAHGLVVILAGIVAGLRGELDTIPDVAHHEPPRETRPHHFDSRFRYCTNFIVTGQGLDSRSFVKRLEEIGDSVLVVGDPATLKVHVHTDEPEVAVAVFEALGAHVVDGGVTLNPSTYEILAGIHEVPAEEVLVLPNSPNVILAAEEAAKLSEKSARVIPSRSQAAALASLVELDAELDAAANAERMRSALAEIRWGSVAPAARADPKGRFVRGDAVGFAGEDVVAWGGAGSTLSATIDRIADGGEIVTVIAGEGAPIPLGELPLELGEGIELELHRGGQLHYWWLI